jgi:pimeloyl-ACP methyl ester carboxylesterase
MSLQNVNGVEVYYEEHGAGTPLLGVHGTPDSAVTWSAAAMELGQHGRCIVYDRRGFHRSMEAPSGALDLSDHVGDAAALLMALRAVPSIVIGRGTGGVIALELARRFPDLVEALVLLEPALFTLDPGSSAWAGRLRSAALERAAGQPQLLAEAVFREAAGHGAKALPDEFREMLQSTGPGTLAECRGDGMAFSEDALELDEDELAGIRRQVLIVSAKDSPEAYRLVNARLSGALPFTRTVLVAGGHLINPAHPAVLDFVDHTAARADAWA